jgi:protein TonB
MKTFVRIVGAVVLAVAPSTAQSPTQTVPSSAADAPESMAQPKIVRELPAARPTHTVDPKYPKDARKQKRQGSVVLHVKVGEDEKVKDLSVVSGDTDFAAAATQAVKKWCFQPDLVDGKPAETEQRVTVNFTLPKESPAGGLHPR